MVFDLGTIGELVINNSLMAHIWEKAIPILAGNSNSGLIYLITTVMRTLLQLMRVIVKNLRLLVQAGNSWGHSNKIKSNVEDAACK